MQHQAFYRKYRPQVFSDVVGRDTITTVLRGQVKSGKVSHAYLFCGMRGSGKTTCAKILAKAVNCLSPVNGDPCGKCEACRAIDSGLTLDVVEMDAASNNGVNDVRDVIDQVTYTPSELKMRVYIIDEVHMLSAAAFNALLKTLEEPPSHVMFILATTEIHKLPATIISRCQRFDFDRLEMSDIVSRLRYVADQEKIECDDEALFVMAKLASGALRDALGYLELCAATGKYLDEKTVSSLLGAGNYDELISIAEAVSEKDLNKAFTSIQNACKQVNDISVLWFDLVSVFRDILIIKTTGTTKFADVTPSQAAKLSSVVNKFTREKLVYMIKVMDDALYLMQRNPAQKRVIADMTIVKLCDEKLSEGAASILSRLAEVEDKIALISAGAPVITAEIKQETKEPKTAPKPSDEAPAKKPVPEDKPTMRLSRKFADVISKMREKEPSCAAFITSATAYECDDGTYRIVFENDFALELSKSNKNLIDSAVISVFGKYTPNAVRLEKSDIKNKYILIDDVIEALENEEENK